MEMRASEALENWAGYLGVNVAGPWKAELWAAGILGLLLLAYLMSLAVQKIGTTLVTLKALALPPMLARRLSNWVKSLNYSDQEFLNADGAGEPWIQVRKEAIDRLAVLLQTQCAKSIAWGDNIRSSSFSDLRFTDAHRVPFPFLRMMREKFNLCSVVTESNGPKLRDLDGNWTLDVSGSYGLNVAGFDRYKAWMQKGLESVKDLGPVLGFSIRWLQRILRCLNLFQN
jgi:glutamate-1-semialdehyde 2,1-aminomutase